jgi:hypothetical protein
MIEEVHDVVEAHDRRWTPFVMAVISTSLGNGRPHALPQAAVTAVARDALR